MKRVLYFLITFSLVTCFRYATAQEAQKDLPLTSSNPVLVDDRYVITDKEVYDIATEKIAKRFSSSTEEFLGKDGNKYYFYKRGSRISSSPTKLEVYEYNYNLTAVDTIRPLDYVSEFYYYQGRRYSNGYDPGIPLGVINGKIYLKQFFTTTPSYKTERVFSYNISTKALTTLTDYKTSGTSQLHQILPTPDNGYLLIINLGAYTITNSFEILGVKRTGQIISNNEIRHLVVYKVNSSFNAVDFVIDYPKGDANYTRFGRNHDFDADSNLYIVNSIAENWPRPESYLHLRKYSKAGTLLKSHRYKQLDYGGCAGAHTESSIRIIGNSVYIYSASAKEINFGNGKIKSSSAKTYLKEPFILLTDLNFNALSLRDLSEYYTDALTTGNHCYRGIGMISKSNRKYFASYTTNSGTKKHTSFSIPYPVSSERVEFYQNVIPNPKNPNNFIEPGQKVRFKVQIENELTQNLPTLKATLSTTQSGITITDNKASYNNVASGSKAWSSDEFEVSVDTSVKAGTTVNFTLSADDEIISGGPWTSSFSFPIQPMVIGTILLDDDDNPDSNGDDDDIPEPGETIEILPTIDNVSNSTFYSVLGKLTVKESFIEIWHNRRGQSGLVYDNAGYNYISNIQQPIKSGATKILPQFDFVVDYPSDAFLQELNFSLNISGYLGEARGSNWDNGGVLMKWSIPKKYNAGITPPPILSSKPFIPADNSTNVNHTTDLRIILSKNVSGVADKYINIYQSDGSLFHKISATDNAQVSISNDTISINPSKNLEQGQGYYILVDQGTFKDSDNKPFAGIAQKTTWNFSTKPAINPPSNLAAQALSSQIKLTWTSAPNAVSYNLYTCSGTYIQNTSATSYTIDNLKPNTPYAYKIESVNKDNNKSAMSACVSARTLLPKPSAPQGLSAKATGYSKIRLVWKSVPYATRYKVLSCDSAKIYTDNLTDTQYVASGLKAKTEYNFIVQASNSAGNSAKSACVKVTTLCKSPWADANVADPSGSTTAYGIVTINGNPADTLDEVGAYVDGQLKGIGKVKLNEGKAYTTILIYGPADKTIKFRVWDQSACATLQVDYTATTKPDNRIGLPPNYLPIAAAGRVNRKPTDLILSKTSIAENKAIGTTIGVLKTTDADAGDTHTYTLESGTDQFEIKADTLKSKIRFDFETKTSYRIRIKTTDGGGLSYSKDFTITISDVNENSKNTPPTNIVLSDTSIAENEPAGTKIGTLTTTDADAGDKHTYTLESGAITPESGAAQFTIEANTLKSAVMFNYETDSIYKITIKTTDAGGLSYSKDFTITISDVNEDITALPNSNSSPESTITLYPNPATGQISFKGLEPAKNLKIEIINSSGQLVKTYTKIQNSYDLSQLPKGTYVAVVQSGTKKQTITFILN